MGSGEFVKLAESLGISLSETDVLLVGDGSGTSIKHACGWAVYLYARGQVRLLTGSLSHGTNNIAELFPYVHALLTWEAAKQPPCRVVIVSDSQVTVRCGNREYSRNANMSLWDVFDGFERRGFSFRFYHVPRNTNVLSVECDRLAGLARQFSAGKQGETHASVRDR